MISLTGKLLESRCKLWVSCGNKSVSLRRFCLECDLLGTVSSTFGRSAKSSSYSTLKLFSILFRIIGQHNFVPIPIFGNLSTTRLILPGTLFDLCHRDRQLNLHLNNNGRIRWKHGAREIIQSWCRSNWELAQQKESYKKKRYPDKWLLRKGSSKCRHGKSWA